MTSSYCAAQSATSCGTATSRASADRFLWEIVDVDQRLYDAWLLMGDSGSIFRARTTEEVAGIVQCGLECDDPAFRREIGTAMVEAELLPSSDSAYKEFAAELAKSRS